MNERISELVIRLVDGPESPHQTTGQPALQLLDGPRPRRHTLAVVFKPGPEQFLRRDRLDELDPSLGRRVRQHSTRPFPIGEVQILRVCPERVGAIAAARHRDLLTRLDEHDTSVEAPRPRGRVTTPLQILLSHPPAATAPESRRAPRSHQPAA